jgi:hypothetical protein
MRGGSTTVAQWQDEETGKAFVEGLKIFLGPLEFLRNCDPTQYCL